MMPRILTALILGAALVAQPAGAGQSADELKVAFLVNFMKFVDWPSKAFGDATAPFIVGLVGEDPFDQTLDEAMDGKTVNGRHVRIQRLSSNDDLSVLHMLFVGASEKGRLRDILRRTGGGSVLSVSDLEGFASAGGVIGFNIEGDRLRFDINATAAARSNLAISSKLLTLARIVYKD